MESEQYNQTTSDEDPAICMETALCQMKMARETEQKLFICFSYVQPLVERMSWITDLLELKGKVRKFIQGAEVLPTDVSGGDQTRQHTAKQGGYLSAWLLGGVKFSIKIFGDLQWK